MFKINDNNTAIEKDGEPLSLSRLLYELNIRDAQLCVLITCHVLPEFPPDNEKVENYKNDLLYDKEFKPRK